MIEVWGLRHSTCESVAEPSFLLWCVLRSRRLRARDLWQAWNQQEGPPHTILQTDEFHRGGTLRSWLNTVMLWPGCMATLKTWSAYFQHTLNTGFCVQTILRKIPLVLPRLEGTWFQIDWKHTPYLTPVLEIHVFKWAPTTVFQNVTFDNVHNMSCRHVGLPRA